MHFLVYILGSLLYNNLVRKPLPIMTDNTQLIADIKDAERSFDDAATHLCQLLFSISTSEQLKDRSLLYGDFLDSIHADIKKAFPNHYFKNF